MDDALDRFAIVDGVPDSPAIDLFRVFIEDFGPGYLSRDATLADEQAVRRRHAATREHHGTGDHPVDAAGVPQRSPRLHLRGRARGGARHRPDDGSAHRLARGGGRHRPASRPDSIRGRPARRGPAAPRHGAGHAARPTGRPGRPDTGVRALRRGRGHLAHRPCPARHALVRRRRSGPYPSARPRRAWRRPAGGWRSSLPPRAASGTSSRSARSIRSGSSPSSVTSPGRPGSPR